MAERDRLREVLPLLKAAIDTPGRFAFRKEAKTLVDRAKLGPTEKSVSPASTSAQA